MDFHFFTMPKLPLALGLRDTKFFALVFKGHTISNAARKGTNFVFLIDVSGSMGDEKTNSNCSKIALFTLFNKKLMQETKWQLLPMQAAHKYFSNLHLEATKTKLLPNFKNFLLVVAPMAKVA